MSDHADTTRLSAGALDARSAIARALASTLQFRDVFATIADGARPILPFERMGITLLEDDETICVCVMAGPAAPAPDVFPALGVPLQAVERDLLQKALAAARNNKSQAAKLLGLPRGQLYSLLRRHGLTDARR